MRHYRIIAVSLTAALALGCSGQLGESEVLEPEVASMTRQDVDMARVAIFEGLDVGRTSIVSSVNRVLSENLLDADFIPGLAMTAPETDIGSCPFVDLSSGDSTLDCRFIVERARDLAYADMTPYLDVGPTAPELDTVEDRAFVSFWFQNGAFSGVDGEVVRAVAQLREVGACDTEPTATENSEMAGYDLGRAVFLQRLEAQIAVTPETECDFDTGVIEPARRAAEAAVTQTLVDQPLCPEFAPVEAEVIFEFDRAKLSYELGIKAGIRDQSTLSSQNMLNTWECTPPPPPDGGGGDGGGGGAGDPLVVDLAGDGVAPVVDSVEFDLTGTGVVKSVAWPAADDALLVVDINGNGTIDNGRELFSNYMVGPGNARFATGFEALALYDAAVMGGDANGVIDANDAIYSELRVWRDSNRNGRSDSGELTDLASVGMTSLSLSPIDLGKVKNGAAVMTERAGNVVELWLELGY